MLVWATRTVSALTLRGLFYGALFVLVVTVHVALTAALRAQGWNGGASLFVSGAVVLALVLALVHGADFVAEKRAADRELERMRQGLPGGPCCVIWRGVNSQGDMPWQVAGGALRARYPKLARRLGVEGVALVEFEISAQGAAKNVHCVYAWPSDVFYAAAQEALAHAKFVASADVDVRYGASYCIPFVFRIAGAARIEEAGHRALPLRPSLRAAQQVVEKLRRSA
jgi:TonB family protein